MNRSPRRVALVLALAMGALCAIAIGACGEDSSTTSSGSEQLLEQTFRATSASLQNGRLDAHLRFEPEGLLALGGPLTLDVEGPFAVPQRDGLARLDLAAVATVAGRRYDGGVVSDGEHAFLKLDGRAYRLDDKRWRRTLTSLGLDPRRWIKSEQRRGSARIAGTDTIRVTGTVDARRLLDDLDGLVPARLREQVADAVTSARFEAWTGTDDKILRQLVLRVSFEVPKGTEPPIQGLDGGRIELRIRLDDVNAAAPRIRAPAKALPLSRLPTGSGLGGLVGCLSDRGGTSADLARCVAMLRP